MDFIKELIAAIGPALLTMGTIIWAIVILLNRTNRLDGTDRKIVLYIMKLTTQLVENKALPPQVLVDQLTDLGEFLTVIPQDDLVQQILSKQIGAK